ncbi:hypothetical protein HWV62_41505 [Athelia sp. TMB]|nr:hypothetical protein HWV62_41505 [Athelia sp. TMB]
MFDPLQAFPAKAARYYLDHTLKGHINNDTGPELIQSAITGWIKFVLPFTPSRYLELSPFDEVLTIVATFMAVMVLDLDQITMKQQDVSSLTSIRSAMPPLWPSLWIWVQTLHKTKRITRALPNSLKAKANAESHVRHMSICDCLLYFIQNEAEILPIAGKFREDVMTLAATIWIEEAEDKESICGFRAVSLLRPELLPAPRISLDILNHIIAACGGKTEAVLKMLYSRIKNNIKHLKLDLSSLQDDFAFVLHHTKNSFTFPAGSNILRRPFLADAKVSIPLLADMMSLLRQSKAEAFADNTERLEIMQSPLFLILEIVCSPHEYQGMSALLTTRFFHLMAWMTPHVPGSTTLVTHTIFASFLQKVGLRFAAHRELFVAMRRNIREAFPKNKMPNGPIADSVKEFREQLSQWTEMNRDYHSGRLDVKVICGNPHTLSSQEIHGALFTEPVGLSGPNLRLLAHAIARDAVSVVRSSSRPTAQQSDMPLIMLNYDDETGMRVKGGIVELQKALPGYPAVWVPYYWMPPGTMSLVSVLACLARGTMENPRESSQALAALLMVTRVNLGSPLERSIYCVKWIYCQ